ncbi:hypothetical protein ACQPWY_20645 [Pseudonocardia xinjiangensis]|uniref:hypothetical protein n=1 Tax=Pseudonocardia xinjiangensis TaxID=75289 RepID=UPI003D8DB136
MTSEPATASTGDPRGRTGVTALARRAVRFEAGSWRSLARWLLRRPDLAPGDTPFPYRGPLLAPMLVMTGLSVLEVVALDLLLPWPGLRLVLLVVGVWGTIMMLGMLAAVTVHPHAAGPSGLRIRHGTSLDVHIGWDTVAGVRHVRRSRPGSRSVQTDDGRLFVLVGGQTTVEIELARPVIVALPGDRSAEVTTVCLYADDSRGLVSAVRASLRSSEP